jgi:hypothetical protein
MFSQLSMPDGASPFFQHASAKDHEFTDVKNPSKKFGNELESTLG